VPRPGSANETRVTSPTAAPDPPPGATRVVLRGVLYVVYLLAVVVAVTAVVHHRYLRSITPAAFARHAPQPATVDALAHARLGFLEAPRRSSFAKAALAKPPGTVRIGCFGDSFTYGTEVRDGDEYAAVLGDLLHRAGHPEVEVLNFGNPGFGFHQTHMMWDLVGRRYGLDAAIVLALPRIWATRDGTFTFWSPPAPTLGFHARYVLDDDGLRPVDVVGRDEAEWFAAYNRLLPPWRYLRYDRKTPSFVRGWLGAGRTLRNLFYYRTDGPDTESFESYRRLLARWSRDGVPTVVWDVDGVLAAPPGGSLAVRRPVPSEGFLYTAPMSHFSRWGHRLLAQQSLRLLGVGGQATIPHVAVRDLDAPAPPAPVGLLAPGEYADVAVGLGPVAVARFFQYAPGKMAATRLTRLPRDVGALLAVALPGDPLPDALFLPLAGTASAPVVTVGRGASRRPLPVERLDAAPGAPRLFRVQLSSHALDLSRDVPPGAAWTVSPPHVVAVPAPDDVRLSVDGADAVRIAALRAQPDEPAGVDVRPVVGYFRIRADPLARGGPEDLPHDGLVELTFRDERGDVSALPLARWVRDDVPAPAPWRPLPAPATP
jgi:hypothetical protein